MSPPASCEPGNSIDAVWVLRWRFGERLNSFCPIELLLERVLMRRGVACQSPGNCVESLCLGSAANSLFCGNSFAISLLEEISREVSSIPSSKHSWAHSFGGDPSTHWPEGISIETGFVPRMGETNPVLFIPDTAVFSASVVVEGTVCSSDDPQPNNAIFMSSVAVSWYFIFLFATFVYYIGVDLYFVAFRSLSKRENDTST